jgi:hypothetical protein
MEYPTAYLDGCGLRDDPKGPLFRTIPHRGGQLTRTPNAPSQRPRHRTIEARASTSPTNGKRKRYYGAGGETVLGSSLRSMVI